MKIDSLYYTLISKMLINLAAGWVAIVLAVPFATEVSLLLKLGLLTGNLSLAILSLIVAFKLRKKGKKR
jgi:hypothetical protein